VIKSAERKYVDDDKVLLTIHRFVESGKIAGITGAWKQEDGTFDQQNESWTHDACAEMEESGDMLFHEEEDCPTIEQIERWYANGNSDFTD